MPFQKRNNLWKSGLKARKANKTRLQRFFEIIADGGIRKYGEKLEELSDGVELSSPELDFMDRVERHLEFVAPKLARLDQKEVPNDVDVLKTYTPRRALDKKE